ncbi:transporter substrate-binding domain-containing protein [Brucella thiophenivorans]|uniref:Bacterial extracellular solute-binding, 3 family protein n=1 Tax=Brucella thiophenivorans TaxID=571255 RepID=A0A256FQN9_9HYPH|nr:transporter substrate-binding domain-containing protein [Brucella thiophenivorans]OYR17133.1 bacterial extracellular solute-binding, 3 family protein [Brucella thiophenivorans]
MKKKCLYIIFFILPAILWFLFNSVKEKEDKIFTIATEGYLRPYNFTHPDGTLDGFEIELGRYVCTHMHVKCSFVAQPFDGIIAGLNAGKYDAIMGGITATVKREEIVSFSEPYSLAPLVFATTKGSKYENLPSSGQLFSLSENLLVARQSLREDIEATAGATIGVVTGTTSDTLVNTFFKDNASVKEYKTVEPALLDLQAGRINMLAHSRAYLKAMQSTPGYGDLVMTGPFFKGPLLGRGAGIVIRKNEPALLGKLNEAIDAAKADGTLKRLANKWIGFDVTP